MTNYKLYQIRSKGRASSSAIIFRLDDYVCYKVTPLGSDEKFIICPNIPPFNTYRVDEYLQIDLDITRNNLSTYNFYNTDVVRRAPSSAVSIPSMNQNQVSTIVRQINSAIDSDERNRYTASIEVNPETGNIIYRLSGERK